MYKNLAATPVAAWLFLPLIRCGCVTAMAYQVKEILYTLQGEGSHAGRPAVFCRFAGCNLWSGREQDRATAVCQVLRYRLCGH